MAERLIKLPEVVKLTGLCKARIYALVKEDRFPKFVKFGASSLWVASEVDSWISNNN
jgi:prophage regulatory protein